MIIRYVLCLLLLSGSTTLFAQTDNDLRGTCKRYWHPAKGGQVVQILKLSGATSGTYTLTKEGSDPADFSSGYWTQSKIWSRGRDSLQVVVLNYENEYEARYYVIQRTGCLTPVYGNGVQVKRGNSFARVGRKD